MSKLASKKVTFQLTTAPGSKVCVAGTFNSWDPGKNPLKENPRSGHYKTVIAIPLGRHEYKFVVDGEWLVDPNCPESVPNGRGSFNSVICVQA